MCDRWLNSFEMFALDMGQKPSKAHSIDRVDPNGDYSPDNCRWATSEQQSLNRRNSKIYTVDGKKMNKGQMAEYLGVSRPKLNRLLSSNSIKVGSEDKALSFGLWPSFFVNKGRWDETSLDAYIRTLTVVLNLSRSWRYTFGDLIANAQNEEDMLLFVEMSKINSPLIEDIQYDQKIAILYKK